MSDLGEEFYVGQDLSWLHGLHHYRVGKVLEVTTDKLYIRGLTSEYWISKKAMSAKLDKPLPHVNAAFAVAMHGG